MKLETLHAIVRANFACKAKPGNKLTADAIENNHMIAMVYFSGITNTSGHTVEAIASLTG